MTKVKWVTPVMMHDERCGRRVPVLTLDQLEAWLKGEHIYCTEEGLLKHLLAQVQAWKEQT